MSEETREVTCICCPMGCVIKVERKGDELVASGFQCKRGEEYAIQEVRDPRRVLTSTVRIEGGVVKMLPVRSHGEIPRPLFEECVRVLASVTVKAPIERGMVIYEDICGTGIDVIASRSMDRKG